MEIQRTIKRDEKTPNLFLVRWTVFANLKNAFNNRELHRTAGRPFHLAFDQLGQ